MKGKNKLAPRLLGVTKDSVLRLDERTKEILKVWPLTTVRRWAASPNTFTLDFGDYSDQYYSVQTTEGEQISQLIAGYIDIILKKVWCLEFDCLFFIFLNFLLFYLFIYFYRNKPKIILGSKETKDRILWKTASLLSSKPLCIFEMCFFFVCDEFHEYQM